MAEVTFILQSFTQQSKSTTFTSFFPQMSGEVQDTSPFEWALPVVLAGGLGLSPALNGMADLEQKWRKQKCVR